MASEELETTMPGPGDRRGQSLAIALGLLAPAWLGAGLLDWHWHRVTKIEENAGARESLTHLLMMTETGLPIVAAAFFEIEAGTIALMAAGVAVHELTAMWDVMYATPRRKVAPREQHTHSFLEVIPYAGLVTAVALFPDRALALFGIGDRKARWGFTRKAEPLSLGFRLMLVAGMGACIGIPYAEEFVRCLRARPTLERRAIPPQPPVTPAHEWALATGAEGYEA